MTTQDQKIPVGYKLTEVGVIPTDWEVRKFGDISKVNQGLQIPIEQRLKNYVEGAKTYITIQYLNGGKVHEYIKEYVQSVCCDKEDILMTRTGNTGFVVTGVEGIFHNNFFKIHYNKKLLDREFLLCFLKAKSTQKIILQKAGASTIPDLNHNDFYSIQIPFPPTLEEQLHIATTLSDIDELISQLDELITKKKQIKQGAMQKLLTPKKDWEVKKFPNVCWFQEGPGVRNYQFTKSGVKLLNGTNIENGKLLLDKTDRFISKKEAYGIYAHFLVDDGDILIACSGITIDKFEEKVTFAGKEHLPLCMNTSTMRFKVSSDKLVKSYLYHFLKSDKFKERIGGKATGSAQLNFGPSHVYNTDIYLPSPQEQTRIATILSDMDQEIQQLEEKKAKYEQLKQGAMQQLLTGKIRLV